MEKSVLHIINEIGKYCQSEKLTLSVAESVTSGYLQYLFSHGEHTTSYFQGGITLYNNFQKFKQFGISHFLTSATQGVSPLVTELLAKGTNLYFNTQIGIGITGFAHKNLDDKILNPHCYIAIALNNKIIHSCKIERDLGSMEQNQIYFATQCIVHLYDNLQNLNILCHEKLFKKQ